MKLAVWMAWLTMAAALHAQAPAGPAKITGAAHMAYYVSDAAKARSWWLDFLGFEEAFAVKNADGADHVIFVKINDHQFVELWVEAPKNHGFLHDVGFETPDASSARASVAALGAKVSPAVSKDVAGDLCFDATDPFGFTIEVVQYLADSRTGIGKGKHMPADRISTHIDHLGILIGDRAAAAKFYTETFGFASEGDGSKQQIGGGPDRFELGFERKPPTIDRFHVKDHICLSASDVQKVAAMLKTKPAAKDFREIETHVLDNGKHVAELYDLDGNRVELMEPPKEPRP